MRAIVCSTPDEALLNTRLVEIEKPLPGPGQVRISMRAASLNPVDWKLASGALSAWHGTGDHLVGLDGAGVVDALGDGVSAVRIGDAVAWHANLNNQGVLADYAVADAHVLSAIPRDVSFEAAAAIPCAGMTAYQALIRKAKLQPSETVLVQGAGGAVGGFAIQIARNAGAKVIALARPEQEERVRQLGADIVIDRRQPDLKTRIREIVADGVDIMLEVVNPGDARESLDLIRYNGQLLCIEPMPDTSRVPGYTYGASIHEIALGGAYGARHIPTQRDFSKMGEALLGMIASKALDPLIERIIPLEAAIYRLRAMQKTSAGGKIVVSIKSD
ncbi:zinc-binding dehydrogenase [Ochrobactrum soli]|uniref:Zinc-binding dehydrogenase n=1 Tax=Ochrobactrum soli TaxID=2448455 RepID=A0A849KVB5_9HYPH|nr:zinc-binding dehydrogenase [[Ochrobactrum] soli]NNU62849.1 zinc-binding dehydrogenase [[Ochrobactrum] soli]